MCIMGYRVDVVFADSLPDLISYRQFWCKCFDVLHVVVFVVLMCMVWWSCSHHSLCRRFGRFSDLVMVGTRECIYISRVPVQSCGAEIDGVGALSILCLMCHRPWRWMMGGFEACCYRWLEGVSPTTMFVAGYHWPSAHRKITWTGGK